MSPTGSNEVEIALPLDGEEIKTGIEWLVAAAVRERLDKFCQLYGKSYPKFHADIKIRLGLENFGPIVVIETDTVANSAEPPIDSLVEDISLTIPMVPPNQFRRDTEQEVPTMVPPKPRGNEVGMVSKAKRGRPPRA